MLPASLTSTGLSPDCSTSNLLLLLLVVVCTFSVSYKHYLIIKGLESLFLCFPLEDILFSF